MCDYIVSLRNCRVMFVSLLVTAVLNAQKPDVFCDNSHAMLWSLSLLFLSGDNILTALNVARACGMISSHEQIIFVQASPPTATSMASLRFNQGDAAAAVVSTQETLDILEQVLVQEFVYFNALM